MEDGLAITDAWMHTRVQKNCISKLTCMQEKDRYSQADREADEWRAREIAKVIARRKVPYCGLKFAIYYYYFTLGLQRENLQSYSSKKQVVQKCHLHDLKLKDE